MNLQSLFTRQRIAALLVTAGIAVTCSSATQAASIAWTFSEIVNIGGAQSETGTGFLANTGDLVFAEN